MDNVGSVAAAAAALEMRAGAQTATRTCRAFHGGCGTVAVVWASFGAAPVVWRLAAARGNRRARKREDAHGLLGVCVSMVCTSSSCAMIDAMMDARVIGCGCSRLGIRSAFRRCERVFGHLWVDRTLRTLQKEICPDQVKPTTGSGSI